jgi:pSer/pThr/pTyr-binding forkhead associated (FHA) protein
MLSSRPAWYTNGGLFRPEGARTRMARGMPAQLVALTDGLSILLDKPILLLGRHPECDIQIDSRKVSRRHCCIAQVHDHLVVRDLGSTNGVRINGVRVVEGRIKSGDELTIGSQRYQVQLEGAAGSAADVSQNFKSRTPIGKSAPGNDDPLESCDEPVALPEPDGLPRPIANAPGAPEPVSPSPPLIVPEHLGLAPASDAAAEPSSPSHHPS